MNFKARKEITSSGKEILVIDPVVVETKHPCGRVDQTVHLPSLAVINKFKEANNIE
jgi:hypothetical protein